MVQFVDDHRATYGVEPICAVFLLGLVGFLYFGRKETAMNSLLVHVRR